MGNNQAGSEYNRPFCKQNQSPTSQFCNYKPDPEAKAIDPLTQPWARQVGSASPIHSLAKCLRKVIHEKVTIILVCPVWPTQSWYAQLLQFLVVDTPILLPTTSGLLTGPQGQEHPLVLPREFQLRISTSLVGPNGWAGMINKWIPLNPVLWRWKIFCPSCLNQGFGTPR